MASAVVFTVLSNRSANGAWNYSGPKALISQAAERNIEGIRDAIERILDASSPSERCNDFKAAGYDPG